MRHNLWPWYFLIATAGVIVASAIGIMIGVLMKLHGIGVSLLTEVHIV